MINLEDFDSSLLQIVKKSYKNIGIYNIEYITMKKIDDYENIINEDKKKCRKKLQKKIIAHILFLILQMKTKQYLKNAQNFGMVLKMRLKQLMLVKSFSMVKILEDYI